MSAIQSAKLTVLEFHAALDAARLENIAAVFEQHTSADMLWRGVHPFDSFHDGPTAANRFWVPLKQALTGLQRRDDIFFAGCNEMDDGASVWVVSMGHLMGLLDGPWLGIRPTGRIAMLRYCTFHLVANHKIHETVMHVDIPHLMVQAGQNPFPPQTGAHMVQPGPVTHDGLLHEARPEVEGIATLKAINAMITNIGQWQSGLPLEEELALDWHNDMLWWGPAGIGASYTIERYAQQHAGPFRAGFANRSRTNHIARLAEGHYGGFFGWPNFTATLTGDFMGIPATGKEGEFRVIDVYRRSGDRLAENWIFIDLLHFWKHQGLDVLEGQQIPG